jgi:hypothetical protein
MGRPPISTSLRADKDRYVFAYYMARRVAFPLETPAALARLLVLVRFGMIRTPDEARAFVLTILRGEEPHPTAQPGEVRGHNDPGAAIHRDRSWIHARGEALLAKCRGIEARFEAMKDDPTVDAVMLKDAVWLASLVTAWLAILGGPAQTGMASLAVAYEYAMQAGEGPYFESDMRPYFFRLSAMLSDRFDFSNFFLGRPASESGRMIGPETERDSD